MPSLSASKQRPQFLFQRLLSRTHCILINPLQQFRYIDHMPCGFLINFHFDLFDCFVRVGLPSYFRQLVQATYHSLV